MFFITNRAFVEGNKTAEMRKVTFDLGGSYERAARLFDTVIVAIADSTAKRPFFTRDERVDMAREHARALVAFAVKSVAVPHGLLTGQNLPAVPGAALSDEQQRHVGQGGQVAGGAHRAQLRHHRHDAGLAAFGVDQAHLAYTNALVDPRRLVDV